MVKPFVVAVDGVDYSGKTEVVNAISDMLYDRTVERFKFPTEHSFGKLAREMISENSRDPADLAKAASYLVSDFATAPLHYITEHTADEHRPVVIYDRYLASMLASQGVAGHREAWNRLCELEPCIPELYIFLVCDYDEAVKRSQSRVKDNWDARLEDSFMCSKDAYDAHSKKYETGFIAVKHMFGEINCVDVNASRPLAEVILTVRSYVLPLVAAGSTHYVSRSPVLS